MPRLRSEGLEWRNAGGEVVVLDLVTSTYFAVNHTGSLLWSRIVDGADRASLQELLTHEHDLTQHQAQADVDRFLGMLRERGLLEE